MLSTLHATLSTKFIFTDSSRKPHTSSSPIKSQSYLIPEHLVLNWLRADGHVLLYRNYFAAEPTFSSSLLSPSLSNALKFVLAHCGGCKRLWWLLETKGVAPGYLNCLKIVCVVITVFILFIIVLNNARLYWSTNRSRSTNQERKGDFGQMGAPFGYHGNGLLPHLSTQTLNPIILRVVLGLSRAW